MQRKGIVVVTGAAGGIGQGIVARLAQDGYTVAALDISNDRLQETVGALTGPGHRAYLCDQTNEMQTRDVINQIESQMGEIEGLVNVTGWVGATRFEDETADYWRKVVAINFEALLFVVHPILKHMIPRKRGKMVFIASDAGRVGTSTEAVYAGMKAGVIAFAKSLARENARYALNFNCVSPGPTETPLLAKEIEDNPDIVGRMTRLIPFRRIGKPSDQAAAVSFLLSPDADYITGQTLSVSGGLTMI
nr:SDR family NAD(P)-dependent oxidoreductase [Mesorhizobium sp. WSM4875]